MMIIQSTKKLRKGRAVLFFALLLAGSVEQPLVWAQNQNSWNPEHSTATTTTKPRELEPEVSLSASTITEILRREPGLLLEFKKLLVRKAYEQGRLLDPADLSDEALFRLLGEEENIRVLATREIEDREYIRAKPTKEELEQEPIERLSPQKLGEKPAGDVAAAESDEEKYWGTHEELRGPQSLVPKSEIPQSSEGSQPGMAMPSQPSSPSQVPAGEPPSGFTRRQYLAGAQPPDRESYDALPPDAGSMPRISPEGLPGLLSTSMSGSDPNSPYSSESFSQRGNSFGLNSQSASGGSSQFPSLSSMAASPLNAWSSMGGEIERNQPNARLDNRFRQTLPGGPQSWPQYYREKSPDNDRTQIRRRVNPYADVPSLYDLYAQVSKRSPVLTRFGEDVFRNGTGNFDELPMDLPVGPDYVLGPGDGLSIELWGGVSQRLQRVVDREGRVALPEAGAIPVTGRSLGEVQRLVQTALRTEFRDVQADVSLARLRTVRVYVVGDVLRPGAYDVSSLSTPLNALYQAGGPTSRGSLRLLRHYRGQQLVEEVDVYSLLLHGVRSSMERLQAGDTILVPPLGSELTVEGMVRRPAIYELDHESNLAEVLELAGGVLNSGTLRHIEVERVLAHQSRTMLQLDLGDSNNQESVTAALEDFKIQDGDKIRISPILPYSEKTVYLDGHVFHPGKYAYREGMRVADLIKAYADLMPEPAQRHAEIIRLDPPDYRPTVIAFNLGDALADKQSEQDLPLKPFDTVRIFGRFDFEDPPTITVSGEVRDPGQRVTNGATHLRDAVYLAGGVTRDALLSDAQIFRRTPDGKLKVLSVDLGKALAGDAADNIPLEPKDRVFIHRNLNKLDPPTVKIEGEVGKPGKYPLGDDMSAAQLVRLAGGLKRGAFTEAADLTRYTVENGAQVLGEHITVPIGRALAGDADTDMRLHDGDVLTIRQLAGWSDVGSLIAVTGDVMHPGEYGIQEGERLSSVLARAGGLRADAYPYGAILERKQVRELEERNRADLIRQVKNEQVAFKMAPDTGDPDDKLAKDATIQQWHSTLNQLESTPPPGRLVIHIAKDPRKWANSSELSSLPLTGPTAGSPTTRPPARSAKAPRRY